MERHHDAQVRIIKCKFNSQEDTVTHSLKRLKLKAKITKSCQGREQLKSHIFLVGMQNVVATSEKMAES